MAHRISEYDKQQGLRQAWHGLTKIVPKLTLDDNYLREWELVPTRLQKNGRDTQWHILQCSDVPELEIGSPYNGGMDGKAGTFRPITNAEFLSLIEASIGGTGHKVVSVGSVRNRGRVFVSIELVGHETFEVAGRKFSAFLNFGNGHDKSSVLWVNTSNTCTVCDNTYTANLISVENKAAEPDPTGSTDISARVRHTKHAVLKFPAVADLIDKAVGVQAQFALAMGEFAAQTISVPDATKLFAGFVGRKAADPTKGLSARAFNTSTRLLALHTGGKGNSGDNLADAFSAVTDYYTHESSGGEDRMKQFVSSEFGAANGAKQDFYRLLQDDDEIVKTISRGGVLLANTED